MCTLWAPSSYNCTAFCKTTDVVRFFIVAMYECVLLQRRYRCLLNTAHLSVISMSRRWCNRSRIRKEYHRLRVSWLQIACVRVPLAACRLDVQLHQVVAALPWQQWLVATSNRWRHTGKQWRASLCSERTASTSTCRIVRDNAATTTNCATATGRGEEPFDLTPLHTCYWSLGSQNFIDFTWNLLFILHAVMMNWQVVLVSGVIDF